MLYAEKIVAQLLYPLDLSLVLAVLVFALWWRNRRRSSLVILVFSLAWLWAWSLPVVSDAVRLTLEGRFQDRPVVQYPKEGAIVVLGGGMVPAIPPKFPYPNLEAASDRVWQAARLYEAGKAPWVIASGGKLPWLGETTPEAVAMRKFLMSLGVPPKAIVMETRSQTTHQNAVDTKPILKRLGIHKVLLVTSALHMPRALATFRGAGIDAIPVPTDYDVRPRPLDALMFLPDAKALWGSRRAIHEYLGRFFYWLRGWTQEDAQFKKAGGAGSHASAGG